MKLSILFIAASILGLGVFAYAYWPQPPQQQSDLRIVYHTTSRMEDGTTRVTSRQTRIQKENGDWKQVQEYIDPEGRVTGSMTSVGVAGRGVFVVGRAKLLFVGDRSEGYKPKFDEEAFRKIPDFIGESTIAGYRVLGQGGAFKFWVALDIGGANLKTERDGSVTEAVSVERGDFGPVTVPDLPIEYSDYREKIERVEPLNPQMADRMRQALPKPY